VTANVTSPAVPPEEGENPPPFEHSAAATSDFTLPRQGSDQKAFPDGITHDDLPKQSPSMTDVEFAAVQDGFTTGIGHKELGVP